MKTISLFGATGGSGKYILRELLNRGYKINALVRKPDALNEFADEYLLKIVGDVQDSRSIVQVLNGADAVIYAIGHRSDSDADLQTKSITKIINLMNEKNIKRLICLSGAGVHLADDKPGIIDKIVSFMIKTIAPNRFNDGKEMVKLVMNSNLKWTIVRTEVQENSEKRGKRTIGYVGKKGHSWKCSRGFIAEFIVDNIETEEYILKSPKISD